MTRSHDGELAPDRDRDRRRERKIRDRTVDQRRQIQSDAISRRRYRNRRCDLYLREIVIDGTISRSVDRDLGSSSLAYIRDLAIDASRDRDLDPVRSRDGEIAINGDWNVCRRDRDRRGLEIAIARARSLSLSLIFQKYFEGKIEV